MKSATEVQDLLPGVTVSKLEDVVGEVGRAMRLEATHANVCEFQRASAKLAQFSAEASVAASDVEVGR